MSQIPTPPGWMDAARVAEWQRAASEVGGEWTAERVHHLEQYASARALWLEAQADLATNGAVIALRNDKGEFKTLQASPYLKVAEDARKTMTALWPLLSAGSVSSDGGPTRDQVERMAAAYRLGLPGAEVAAAGGVSVGQLRAWLARAAEGDEVCGALEYALQEARDGEA